MNELFTWVLLGLVLLIGATIGFYAIRGRSLAREQRLRRDGYRLIHELKAYSAWIESLRGEPFLPSEPEEHTAAAALRNARAIAQAAFPALQQPLLRLLQADSHLMAHLWQQKLLRLGDAGGWRPVERDPTYQQMRDEQDDLIEDIIARCQVLIGERGRAWRGTDIDTDFSGTFSMSTSPCA